MRVLRERKLWYHYPVGDRPSRALTKLCWQCDLLRSLQQCMVEVHKLCSFWFSDSKLVLEETKTLNVTQASRFNIQQRFAQGPVSRNSKAMELRVKCLHYVNGKLAKALKPVCATLSTVLLRKELSGLEDLPLFKVKITQYQNRTLLHQRIFCIVCIMVTLFCFVFLHQLRGDPARRGTQSC